MAKPKKTKGRCCVDGCDKEEFCKGYCCKHYKQQYRHNKILERTIYDENDFIFHDDFIEIVLYDKKGEETGRTIIDKDDYDIVKDYKWCYDGHGYAVTHKNKNEMIKLHRLIMNNCESEVIDHINGNRLDNRKCNLRKATFQQNSFNIDNNGQGSNNRKGVSYRKDRGKWRAYITVNDKQIVLGSFNTEEEAIKAREEAEIKYFGEYRRK